MAFRVRKRLIVGAGKSGTSSRNTSETAGTSISRSGGILNSCAICCGVWANLSKPISPVSASRYQVASGKGNTSTAAPLRMMRGTMRPVSSAPQSSLAARSLPSVSRTGSDKTKPLAAILAMKNKRPLPSKTLRISWPFVPMAMSPSYLSRCLHNNRRIGKSSSPTNCGGLISARSTLLHSSILPSRCPSAASFAL